MPSPHPRPHPKEWRHFQEKHHAHGWRAPFFFLEWIWEWTAHYLSNWAFLEVLEYFGKLSVLAAVVFYFIEWPDRVMQRHYQAWQVINTSQGKGGSGGRIEALEELNKDGLSLIGVNVEGAFLRGIRLEKALLARANFNATDLRMCHLEKSDLQYADLTSANLRNGDLTGANLGNADLKEADLEEANLSGADFTGADLASADLSNCDLRGIKWKNIASVKQANIYHAKNPPPGFTEWALKQGAVSVESHDD
jgi:hypothetical protein